MLLVTNGQIGTHMSACSCTHTYTHSPKKLLKTRFIGKGTVGSPGEGSRTLTTLFPLLPQIKKLLRTGEEKNKAVQKNVSLR